MRDLSLGEVLQLYHQIVVQSGSKQGIRDLGAPEAALAQPRATFGGQELYCHSDYHPRSPLRPRLNRQSCAHHRKHRAVQRESLTASLLRQFRLV